MEETGRQVSPDGAFRLTFGTCVSITYSGNYSLDKDKLRSAIHYSSGAINYSTSSPRGKSPPYAYVYGSQLIGARCYQAAVNFAEIEIRFPSTFPFFSSFTATSLRALAFQRVVHRDAIYFWRIFNCQIAFRWISVAISKRHSPPSVL